MKNIVNIIFVSITASMLIGCATWNGLKTDSSNAWDTTKEESSKAYDSTKKAIHEATK